MSMWSMVTGGTPPTINIIFNDQETRMKKSVRVPGSDPGNNKITLYKFIYTYTKYITHYVQYYKRSIIMLL